MSQMYKVALSPLYLFPFPEGYMLANNCIPAMLAFSLDFCSGYIWLYLLQQQFKFLHFAVWSPCIYMQIVVFLLTTPSFLVELGINFLAIQSDYYSHQYKYIPAVHLPTCYSFSRFCYFCVLKPALYFTQVSLNLLSSFLSLKLFLPVKPVLTSQNQCLSYSCQGESFFCECLPLVEKLQSFPLPQSLRMIVMMLSYFHSLSLRTRRIL